MPLLSRRRVLGAAGAVLLASCTRGVAADTPRPTVAALRPDSPFAANASLGIWPDLVVKASAAVRATYAYAATMPRSLRYIPCYCGCGASGHDDNLACYVQRVGDGGWVVLDPHASVCGVCVGITADVIAMERQGRTLADIRHAVDAKWSQAGPGTPTPLP